MGATQKLETNETPVVFVLLISRISEKIFIAAREILIIFMFSFPSAAQDLEQPQIDLDELKHKINQFLEQDRPVIDIFVIWKKPIMFYRPQQADGGWFLKLYMGVGQNTKSAGESIIKVVMFSLYNIHSCLSHCSRN